MTEHETEARRRFAALLGRPEELWSVVHTPVLHTWYDFFDPVTGEYGQCSVTHVGVWTQAPLGDQPVILAYDHVAGRRWLRRRHFKDRRPTTNEESMPPDTAS